jgi:hypothetical protein
MQKSLSRLFLAPLGAILLASFTLAPVADARERGGGGGRQVGQDGGPRGGGRDRQVNDNRRDVRTNNVRNTSVNNVNVNRNVNVDVDRHGGWNNNYHPVATAAAVTATVAVTAAVVGSIVRSVPPNCSPYSYRGMTYQQCGGTWYQPQYVGNDVQYVVVNAPY